MARSDKENLTGKVFGYLTVISENNDQKDKKHSYWNCECKCGNECIKRLDALKTTPVPSCGCHKKEATSNYWSADLTNQTFGKLKVIKRVNNAEKRALWECECECGNICYLYSRYLLSMNVKSCGCDTKSYGELYVREQLQFYKFKFKEQYGFSDCLSPKGRRIKFDFAIFDDNKLKCLIEVNGVQHYKPVEYFGGEERFELQQEIDNIKRSYCKEHNISLIEIPYVDIGKIDLLKLIEGDKKLMYKIWVDDCRTPPDGYIWFKTVNKTIDFILIHNDEIDLLDLYHDASIDYVSDGGDYIKILDFLEKTFPNIQCKFHIHSMNVVGVENMRRIIQRNGWEEV